MTEKKYREWDYKLPETIEGTDKEKKDPCPVSGTVRLKMLPAAARFKIGQSLVFGVNEKGELYKKEESQYIEELLNIAEDHIISISLKNKETGYEYADFEDFSFDEISFSVLAHIGAIIIRGMTLGKNLDSQSKGK